MASEVGSNWKQLIKVIFIMRKMFDLQALNAIDKLYSYIFVVNYEINVFISFLKSMNYFKQIMNGFVSPVLHKRIQNPIQYVRWSILPKQLVDKSRKLFRQNTPS